MSQNTPPKDDERRDQVRQPEDEGFEGKPGQAQGAAPAAAPGKPDKVDKPSRRLKVIIIALTVIAMLLILFAWRLPPFSSTFERTENAYVRGQVTTISPQVSGYVAQVLVDDFAQVEAGRPLFRIDDRIYRQQLEQARANLAGSQAQRADSAQAKASSQANVRSRQAALVSARAELARTQADMRRVAELAKDGSLSIRELEQTEAGLRSAQSAVQQAAAATDVSRQDERSVEVARGGLDAAVLAAEAQVRLAEINLSNTVVVAPESGRLGQIGARQGQYVTAGTQLVSLVPPRRWIIANYKERQAGSMRPGQPAVITVDGLDDQRFTGRVREISPATGSEFAVMPAQNATGNFTKVAQRLPIRIELEPNQPGLQHLRPGMSVVARVDTSAAPKETQE